MHAVKMIQLAHARTQSSGVSRTGLRGEGPKVADLSALVKVSASRGVARLLFFKHNCMHSGDTVRLGHNEAVQIIVENPWIRHHAQDRVTEWCFLQSVVGRSAVLSFGSMFLYH